MVCRQKAPVGGWVVGGHHPQVLTYVARVEIGIEGPPGHPTLNIGIHGRSKRDRDARDSEVIHVHINPIVVRGGRKL